MFEEPTLMCDGERVEIWVRDGQAAAVLSELQREGFEGTVLDATVGFTDLNSNERTDVATISLPRETDLTRLRLYLRKRHV